ncbi:MAG: hypothetical protein ACRDDH_11745 [Cetobacterium sp.]|uniref:hypothetical protein n=1 Tax=Cetobacterium sp. TaxID=2071632 RepID=UPI003EE80E83
MFKVDQKVWTMKYGWGKVEKVEHGKDYPVKVKFDEGTRIAFTFEGGQWAGHPRTLFFDEFQIPKSALNPPRWRAEKDRVYFFINSVGVVVEVLEFLDNTDEKRYQVENYFQTRKEAEDSKFYKVFQEA